MIPGGSHAINAQRPESFQRDNAPRHRAPNWVALVAAGIIGYFIDSAMTEWAAVPVGIGLVLRERAAKKTKGGR